MFRAIEVAGDTTPLVRPQSGERIRIGRALDLGARGVMVPRLDSAAQALEAVTFLRYPPDGIRGVATRVRGAGLGVVGHPDVHRLNERVVGIIQIELVGGLRDADEIAAIDGVDVLFVGPADLSHSLGIPGQFQHADYLGALDRVVAACRAHGKAAGILRLRHRRRSAPPRARVHVRRDRRGCGVRRRGRPAVPHGAPRLTADRPG